MRKGIQNTMDRYTSPMDKPAAEDWPNVVNATVNAV